MIFRNDVPVTRTTRVTGTYFSSLQKFADLFQKRYACCCTMCYQYVLLFNVLENRRSLSFSKAAAKLLLFFEIYKFYCSFSEKSTKFIVVAYLSV